jgi:hypothetical protein
MEPSGSERTLQSVENGRIRREGSSEYMPSSGRFRARLTVLDAADRIVERGGPAAVTFARGLSACGRYINDHSVIRSRKERCT